MAEKINKTAASLWAWMTEYPDGSYGTVGMGLPGLGMVPLIARSEEAIRNLEPVARRHGKELGQRVWLRRYEAMEDYA